MLAQLPGPSHQIDMRVSMKLDIGQVCQGFSRAFR